MTEKTEETKLLQEEQKTQENNNNIDQIFTKEANQQIDQILKRNRNQKSGHSQSFSAYTSFSPKNFSQQHDKKKKKVNFQDFDDQYLVHKEEQEDLLMDNYSCNTDSSIHDSDFLENFEELMQFDDNSESFKDAMNMEIALYKDSKIVEKSRRKSSQIKKKDQHSLSIQHHQKQKKFSDDQMEYTPTKLAQSRMGRATEYFSSAVDTRLSKDNIEQFNKKHKEIFVIQEHDEENNQNDNLNIQNIKNYDPEKYDLYDVEKGDTLFGIALKFNVNETPQGSIIGYLKILESGVMFDPDVEILKKKNGDKDLISKYQVSIEMKDIHECKIIDQPQDSYRQSVYQRDKILQLNLLNNGSKMLHKHYKKRLQQLRKQGRPIITIFFRISQTEINGNELSFNEKNQIMENIQQIINENARKVNKSVYNYDKDQDILNSLYPSQIKSDEQNQDEQEDMFEHSITRVKVYEIIKENLYDKSVPKSIWKGLGFEPKMVGEFASNIMNNKIFLSIVIKVPNVFRCNNWELIYGNIAHGTSFNTLLSQCDGEYPIFMIIEDFDQNYFGAYISDPIERQSDRIYGSGETFVFSFANEKKHIQVYEATGKNEDFLYVDDGIVIGCSTQVALFIDKNLLRGHSQPCDTFDSPILSSNTNFSIKNIEIWGLSL